MVETDLRMEQINELHRLAKRVVELKPWEFVPPNSIFGIRLPGSVESAYIQIIGQAGEEFGILAVVGEESLHRLRRVLHGGELIEVRILAMSFDATDELPPQLLRHEKDSIVEIRGKQFIPTYTSHIPGRTSWLLSAAEADELQQYLVQAIEVLQRKTTENFMDLGEDPEQCLYRTHLMGQWVDSVEAVPPDPRKGASYKIPSPLLKLMWKIPPHTHGFQAELMMMPAPYGPGDTRRVFPYVLFLVDEKDGYAFHELIPPDPTLRRMELSIPGLLLQKLCDLRLKPPRLTVPEGGKLHTLIDEMGAGSLPFPVKTARDPEPISGLMDSFWESFLRGFPGDGNGEDEYERVFLIKVALMHDKRTYRKIAIGSGQTMDTLHDAIFDAFEREEEHLYSFFLPRKPTTSKRVIMKSPAISPPAEDEFTEFANDLDSEETTIGELNLKEKQKFYYLFDWGDEWWHELTFEGEIEFDGEELPAVTVKKGDSPPQYPDWDEDEE